ncbi:MAG: hypothetical protein VX815_07035 [Gemmatimonadota bacterium]|nr:hypothetical protein [Gemmatimonadota bacterium]
MTILYPAAPTTRTPTTTAFQPVSWIDWLLIGGTPGDEGRTVGYLT